jgi:hypothetical protein
LWEKKRVARARSWWRGLERPSLARLNVRLPEPLRSRLEIEARSQKHSVNTEIVRRLRDSFLTQDNPTKVIAQLLLDNLDGQITSEMVDIVMRDHAQEQMAEAAREEEQIERGLREESEK